MDAMNWMKGVVVALGLSLGGSALAAGPAPVYGQNQSAGLHQRERGDNGRDGWNDRSNQGWNDGWLNDGFDRFDRHERRVFRIGKQKIADGRALQARGQTMLQSARWSRSPVLARRAHRLIERGEALEREGRMLVRRVRSS